MAYVDGFVIPVPDGQRETYLAVARMAAEVFREHGASRVVECWGDDVPEGKFTSFPTAVRLEEGESVVFSWIEWPSREARDEGLRKAMADERLQDAPMPFDGKRMIMGGFAVMLDR